MIFSIGFLAWLVAGLRPCLTRPTRAVILLMIAKPNRGAGAGTMGTWATATRGDDVAGDGAGRAAIRGRLLLNAEVSVKAALGGAVAIAFAVDLALAIATAVEMVVATAGFRAGLWEYGVRTAFAGAVLGARAGRNGWAGLALAAAGAEGAWCSALGRLGAPNFGSDCSVRRKREGPSLGTCRLAATVSL